MPTLRKACIPCPEEEVRILRVRKDRDAPDLELAQAEVGYLGSTKPFLAGEPFFLNAIPQVASECLPTEFSPLPDRAGLKTGTIYSNAVERACPRQV